MKNLHFGDDMIRIILLVTFVALYTYTSVSFAQTEFSVRLQRQLNLYYDTYRPEQVYLNLHQPYYAPGDTVFFRAYLFSVENRAPLPGRELMHILLVNSSGEIVIRENILLHDGKSGNQLIIPPTMEPGRYKLVAYTPWMMNSDPALYFIKDIFISGVQTLEEVSKDKETRFFFEGGHFVTGVPNKVIVESLRNRVGVIRNGFGDELVSFGTDDDGTGSFIITPKPEEIYTINIANKKVQLPPSQSDGVALLVAYQDSLESVQVAIMSPERKNTKLQLLIISHRNISYKTPFFLRQNDHLLRIPIQFFPPGVSQIVVVDETGKLEAQRLFFVPPTDLKVTIESSRPSYRTREKVTVKVNVANKFGLPEQPSFSVTVYNSELTRPGHDGNNIGGVYLGHLGSGEYPGPMDGLNDGYEGVERVNTYLITRTWNRFSWESLMKEKMTLRHLRKKNLFLSGRLVDENTQRPVPDSTSVTLWLEKNGLGFETRTNSKGVFEVPVFSDFWGSDNLFCRAELRGNPLTGIRLEMIQDSLVLDYPKEKPSGENDPYELYSKQKSAVQQSFNYFGQKQSAEPPMLTSTLIEDEATGADIIVDFGKHILPTSMEETLRDVVPMVRHRKIGNENAVRVFLKEFQDYARHSPTYVIDGILTNDTQFFLQLRPSDIARIKIINTPGKCRRFGLIGKYGILLVESKTGTLGMSVPLRQQSAPVSGFNPSLKFQSPSHEQGAYERIPDLRSCLYWQPEANLDESGNASFSFYTSDDEGDFVIQVEGMTETGQPFRATKTLKVSHD